MIYITKQEGLYQNKVNSSLVSTCNCKMDYCSILSQESHIGGTWTIENRGLIHKTILRYLWIGHYWASAWVPTLGKANFGSRNIGPK